MSKLYFRYSAMNAGKTTAVLQVAHNYEERGMNILLVKPAVDTKGGDKIVSRLGIERKVDILLKDDELVSKLVDFNNIKPNAIIVDEAQFLTPEQVDDLYYISKLYDVPVLCYGLRCDFQMKPFRAAPRLLEIADDIEELKTICKCGVKATQNLRFVNGIATFDGDQVAIDGENNVTYDSVCGKCYIRLRNNWQEKKGKI